MWWLLHKIKRYIKLTSYYFSDSSCKEKTVILFIIFSIVFHESLSWKVPLHLCYLENLLWCLNYFYSLLIYYSVLIALCKVLSLVYSKIQEKFRLRIKGNSWYCICACLCVYSGVQKKKSATYNCPSDTQSLPGRSRIISRDCSKSENLFWLERETLL